MFVRTKSSKKAKHETVQIVESERLKDGKVRQRVIASLGVVRCEEDKQALIRLGQNLILKFSDESTCQQSFTGAGFGLSFKPKEKANPNLIDYKNLAHVKDYQCGFSDVFGKLSDDLGFTEALSAIDDHGAHEFSILEIIQTILVRRIQEPESKRASFLRELLEGGSCGFQLHQIYRAMDALLPHADEIQKRAHVAAAHLFPNVNSYYYDATTLFFESVKDDELKGFGFSKDCKFNQVQVVVCLLVTEQGLPIGYEVFKGNTAETKTLETAIKNLSQRYDVRSHTVVCDRGMLSKENLKSVSTGGALMHYIVGEKIRSLPRDYRINIFDSQGYKDIGDTKVKLVNHPTRDGAMLLLAHSDERAKKDKADRDRLVTKLKKRLASGKAKTPKDYVNNHGVKKYVSMSGGTATLNEQAILDDTKWDGFFGIVTNNKTLTPDQVLSHYRGLWQVEANFRIFKHDLSARPIYHYSDKRIRAHILICFMALTLERHLNLRLKMAHTPLTTTNVYNSLRMCKKIILQDTKNFRLFELQSNKPIEAKQIYDVLGLNWRSSPIELNNPKKLVVPSLTVKPANLLI